MRLGSTPVKNNTLIWIVFAESCRQYVGDGWRTESRKSRKRDRNTYDDTGVHEMLLYMFILFSCVRFDGFPLCFEAS